MFSRGKLMLKLALERNESGNYVVMLFTVRQFNTVPWTVHAQRRRRVEVQYNAVNPQFWFLKPAAYRGYNAV